MTSNKSMKSSSRNTTTWILRASKGLGVLFFVEFWERFSYYGMRAMLIFYMYFALQENGLGMDKTTAMSIMSVYGSLIYMSSIQVAG